MSHASASAEFSGEYSSGSGSDAGAAAGAEEAGGMGRAINMFVGRPLLLLGLLLVVMGRVRCDGDAVGGADQCAVPAGAGGFSDGVG